MSKPSMEERTAAVKAKYPTMYEILTRAAKPGNWLAIITLVLEFLGPWLEQCMETEEQFIEAVQDFNLLRAWRLERRARNAMRAEGGYSRRDRVTLAEKAVDEGWAAFARAPEEELCTCFREVKSAA